MGVRHTLTSPYNIKSNGGSERAIRSLKDCLKRDGVKKLSQEILDKLTFNINSHPQDDRCVVQDNLNLSKRWDILATIKGKRASEDGTFRSFVVEKDDGSELLRNSRFLKHQSKNADQPGNHVVWANPFEAESA